MLIILEADPFWGLYVERRTPHFERGSASRDNFYESSGMYLAIDKSNGKNFIPVINLLFVVDPKSSQFGKNINDLEGFEVINVNIWHPEIMNKLQID